MFGCRAQVAIFSTQGSYLTKRVGSDLVLAIDRSNATVDNASEQNSGELIEGETESACSMFITANFLKPVKVGLNIEVI